MILGDLLTWYFRDLAGFNPAQPAYKQIIFKPDFSIQELSYVCLLYTSRHVLIYNDFSTLPGTPKGPRTPLCVAVSDDGIHWKNVMTLEDSPISQYSYPSLIQGKDGKLHAVCTWRRQRVRCV